MARGTAALRNFEDLYESQAHVSQWSGTCRAGYACFFQEDDGGICGDSFQSLPEGGSLTI